MRLSRLGLRRAGLLWWWLSWLWLTVSNLVKLFVFVNNVAQQLFTVTVTPFILE